MAFFYFYTFSKDKSSKSVVRLLRSGSLVGHKSLESSIFPRPSQLRPPALFCLMAPQAYQSCIAVSRPGRPSHLTSHSCCFPPFSRGPIPIFSPPSFFSEKKHFRRPCCTPHRNAFMKVRHLSSSANLGNHHVPIKDRMRGLEDRM